MRSAEEMGLGRDWWRGERSERAERSSNSHRFLGDPVASIGLSTSRTRVARVLAVTFDLPPLAFRAAQRLTSPLLLDRLTILIEDGVHLHRKVSWTALADPIALVSVLRVVVLVEGGRLLANTVIPGRVGWRSLLNAGGGRPCSSNDRLHSIFVFG